MNIIKTNFFLKQIISLKKKFIEIEKDIDNFELSIEKEAFSDLGNGVYKYRIKNSSIPVGKRSGFRLIVLFLDKKNVIPLMIYSKNQKENVSSIEILYAKEKILEEIIKTDRN